MNLSEIIERLNSEVNISNLTALYAGFGVLLFILFFFNLLLLIYLNYRIKKQKGRQELSYSQPRCSCKDFAPLFILAVLFTAWKILFLGKDDINILESANIGFVLEAMRGNYSILLDFMINPGHQPFYFILSGLIQFMNNSCLYLRLISVVFSTLAALIVFYLCLEIFNNKFIAYLAFIFLNLHANFSFYSRKADTYIIFCCFELLSYYYFWRSFISNREKGIWKYSLVNIICFFTHYLSLVAMFSQLLAIFMIKWRHRNSVTNFKILQFIKSLTIFNFIFILWLPCFYISFFTPASFSGAYNNLYLPKENVVNTLSSIMKLILGFSNIKLLNWLLVLLLPFIIFRTRKKREIFPVFILSVFLSACSASGYYIYCYYLRYINRFYFSSRYLLWIVPFVAIFYAYCIDLVRKQKSLYKKISGYLFFLILCLWNFYLTNKIIVTRMTPAYKKALYFIKQEFKEKDFIAWPIKYFYFCIPLNAKGILDLGFYDPKDTLSEKKAFYERIWLIVPKEVYFDIPDIDYAAVDKEIDFFAEGFSLDTTWQGEHIEVLLFKKQKDNNHGPL